MPVSVGGKEPEGSFGVTRPFLPTVVGAGSGIEIPSSGVVVIDGKDPTSLPASGATQPTALPPFTPEQLHVHGPLPLTALEIPPLQRPLRGVVKVGTPFAEPQTPLIGEGGCNGAVQLTVMPLFSPIQLQFHGPLPLTELGVPVEQRLSIGCTAMATPFAEPQRPLTEGPGGGGAGGVFFCEPHEAASPPFMPEQVQVHGPSP